MARSPTTRGNSGEVLDPDHRSFQRAFIHDPATVIDVPFSFTAACAPNSDPSVGSSCAVTTTADATVPGSVVEGKRAIWELGQIEVLDGGADGIASTGPNTVFARQGVFTP